MINDDCSDKQPKCKTADSFGDEIFNEVDSNGTKAFIFRNGHK